MAKKSNEEYRLNPLFGTERPVVLTEDDFGWFEKAFKKDEIAQKIAESAKHLLAWEQAHATELARLERYCTAFAKKIDSAYCPDWDPRVDVPLLHEARKKFHDLIDTERQEHKRWFEHIFPIIAVLVTIGLVPKDSFLGSWYTKVADLIDAKYDTGLLDTEEFREELQKIQKDITMKQQYNKKTQKVVDEGTLQRYGVDFSRESPRELATKTQEAYIQQLRKLYTSLLTLQHVYDTMTDVEKLSKQFDKVIQSYDRKGATIADEGDAKHTKDQLAILQREYAENATALLRILTKKKEALIVMRQEAQAYVLDTEASFREPLEQAYEASMQVPLPVYDIKNDSEDMLLDAKTQYEQEAKMYALYVQQIQAHIRVLQEKKALFATQQQTRFAGKDKKEENYTEKTKKSIDAVQETVEACRLSPVFDEMITKRTSYKTTIQKKQKGVQQQIGTIDGELARREKYAHLTTTRDELRKKTADMRAMCALPEQRSRAGVVGFSQEVILSAEHITQEYVKIVDWYTTRTEQFLTHYKEFLPQATAYRERLATYREEYPEEKLDVLFDELGDKGLQTLYEKNVREPANNLIDSLQKKKHELVVLAYIERYLPILQEVREKRTALMTKKIDLLAVAFTQTKEAYLQAVQEDKSMDVLNPLEAFYKEAREAYEDAQKQHLLEMAFTQAKEAYLKGVKENKPDKILDALKTTYETVRKEYEVGLQADSDEVITQIGEDYKNDPLIETFLKEQGWERSVDEQKNRLAQQASIQQETAFAHVEEMRLSHEDLSSLLTSGPEYDRIMQFRKDFFPIVKKNNKENTREISELIKIAKQLEHDGVFQLTSYNGLSVGSWHFPDGQQRHIGNGRSLFTEDDANQHTDTFGTRKYNQTLRPGITIEPRWSAIQEDVSQRTGVIKEKTQDLLDAGMKPMHHTGETYAESDFYKVCNTLRYNYKPPLSENDALVIMMYLQGLYGDYWVGGNRGYVILFDDRRRFGSDDLDVNRASLLVSVKNHLLSRSEREAHPLSQEEILAHASYREKMVSWAEKNDTHYLDEIKQWHEITNNLIDTGQITQSAEGVEMVGLGFEMLRKSVHDNLVRKNFPDQYTEQPYDDHAGSRINLAVKIEAVDRFIQEKKSFGAGIDIGSEKAHLEKMLEWIAEKYKVNDTKKQLYILQMINSDLFGLHWMKDTTGDYRQYLGLRRYVKNRGVNEDGNPDYRCGLFLVRKR